MQLTLDHEPMNILENNQDQVEGLHELEGNSLYDASSNAGVIS